MKITVIGDTGVCAVLLRPRDGRGLGATARAFKSSAQTKRGTGRTERCVRHPPAEVGKTSILLRFAEGDFNLSFISTIG